MENYNNLADTLYPVLVTGTDSFNRPATLRFKAGLTASWIAREWFEEFGTFAYVIHNPELLKGVNANV